MKRYLAYLLTLCMLLACMPAALADGDAVLHGYVSTWDNYGLSKEPITLTVGCGVQDLPASTLDNLEIELIKQATGITIEFVGYDSEKFAVMVAGGDLPDIFSLENSNMINDLIDSGAALDMLPYLDQYGSNIHQVHDSYALTWSKNLYGNGEHVYFIPSSTTYMNGQVVPSEDVGYGYHFRWDIYQAIGAPSLLDENNTFSEDVLLDVMKQMQDYAREKTGDDNIYALSGWQDWGTHWVAVIPYGMSVSHKLNSYTDELTGLVENGDIFGDPDSHYYDALRFYNKAWRMGILDPELFTLSISQYCDKIKNGTVLVSNMGFSHNDFSQSVIDTFGDGVEMYTPKGLQYCYGLLRQDGPAGFGVFASDFINVNCKYPERAVALLDYLRSDEFCRATNSGLQGVHWDYDETGKPVYIGEAAEAYANDTLGTFFDISHGNFKFFPANKLGMSEKLCADGYLSKFTRSADYTAMKSASNQNMQDYLAFYGSSARYPGEMYLEWVEEGVTNVAGGFNAKLCFKPSASDEINALKSKCEQYFNDNSPKVVFANTEEEAEAAVAKMVSDEQAMGCVKLLEDELSRQEKSFEIAQSLGF